MWVGVGVGGVGVGDRSYFFPRSSRVFIMLNTELLVAILLWYVPCFFLLGRTTELQVTEFAEFGTLCLVSNVSLKKVRRGKEIQREDLYFHGCS